MGIPILRAVARMVLSPSAIQAVADMALRASAIPTVVALRNIVRSRRGLPPVRIFSPEMVQRQPAVGGGPQLANNKKAMVTATVTFEGLDVSQLESLLPLVYQHFDLVGLSQTVYKHFAFTLPHKARYNIHFSGGTAFKGFEVSETEYLAPTTNQYLKSAQLFIDKLPKSAKILKNDCGALHM